MGQCRVGYLLIKVKVPVVDPDQNPYDLEPPGSGSVGQKCGSGSFYHQAKIDRKTWITSVL